MGLQIKKNKAIIALLAVTCLLGAAGAVYASGGEGKSMMEGSLSPAKLKDFGWRVMNFVALMIILIKYVKPPLLNALAGRKQTIADQFEDLTERKAEVEQNYQKCEEKLSKIDDQVNSILENAKAQAEAEKSRIIADAERSAEDIKRKGTMAVQFELSAARQQLQTEIAEQATAMAEGLIKDNLQESDQNIIIEDYLEKVGAMQ
jgi:F-type H+-transporting ATPase subunit b